MALMKKKVSNLELFREWIFASDRDIYDSVVQPSDSPSPNNPFRVGMKLEAVDRKFPSLICVTSVIRVVGNELLIFFDGWEHNYDYWCHYRSPELRPIDTCIINKLRLHIPNARDGASDKWEGSWKSYLKNTGATTLPSEKFFPLYLPENNDSVFSLFELCARALLSDEKVDTSVLPPKVFELLQDSNMCTICGTKFLRGWRCISMFTCQFMIAPTHPAFYHKTRIVCSDSCAVVFTNVFQRIIKY